jgi:sarcosine oxidase subunit beta
MRLSGVDAELLTREQVRDYLPYADFDNARFPIRGALMQARAGTVRHDAVAWGYARGADSQGVDIIEHCEVTGIRIEQGVVKGVETNRGFIGANKIGLAVAGSSSRVASLAGLRLPIEAHVIQAFVTEGIKPLIDNAAISTAIIPTHNAAIYPWWKTLPKAVSRCFPTSRGFASCALGRASST